MPQNSHRTPTDHRPPQNEKSRRPTLTTPPPPTHPEYTSACTPRTRLSTDQHGHTHTAPERDRSSTALPRALASTTSSSPYHSPRASPLAPSRRRRPFLPLFRLPLPPPRPHRSESQSHH
ncbi:unnamed protein product [Gadus morhua 'NCC']